MVEAVLELIHFAHLVKELPRTGWNLEFPPGHFCLQRKVQNPETVGSHMFGLAFLAILTVSGRNLNALRVLELCVTHDLLEGIDGDEVTATEDNPIKRKALKDQRRQRELKLVGQIRGMGTPQSSKVADLLEEYIDNETPEAQFVNQLDKVEACLQANRYKTRGKDDQVNPQEFVLTSRRVVTDPQLLALLDHIQEQCVA